MNMAQTVADAAAAVRAANDTSHGLAASLYTDNRHIALMIARTIRPGTLSTGCFLAGAKLRPSTGGKNSPIWRRRGGSASRMRWPAMIGFPASADASCATGEAVHVKGGFN